MKPPTRYVDHYKKLIALGVPIVIGQIGIIVLGFADTLMIGHYNIESLGAASFVNNLFNLVIIGSTGFSYGLTPIVGALFGRHDKAGIGGKLKNALFVNFTVAVLFTTAMTVLFFHLDRLGQPAELMPLVKPYYSILLASLVFILLFNAFKQFADGIMDTRTSMWILLFGNLLNIVGNYLLIYGTAGFPELGLLGAGLATLFSRIVMLAVFIGLFFSLPRYRPYKTAFLKACLTWADFRQLNAMGSSDGYGNRFLFTHHRHGRLDRHRCTGRAPDHADLKYRFLHDVLRHGSGRRHSRQLLSRKRPVCRRPTCRFFGLSPDHVHGFSLRLSVLAD